jgi:hypothetical protein
MLGVHTNIELINLSVAIFAKKKAQKISPAKFPAHVVVRSAKFLFEL